VAWECWNGSEWVQTHLPEHGRDLSAPGTVVDQEPGVPGTMPAVGYGVPDTFTITVPDVPPGWYQLREVVEGSDWDRLLPVEVIAPGESFAYDDVVSAIEAAGVTVVEAGTAPGDPFTVDARLLGIRGHRVRVYEYPDVVAQVEETATIGMEGWSVRGTPVGWIAPPVYWAKGRVIVLYLGQDSEPIGILAQALGDMLRLGLPSFPVWTFFGEVTHIEWTGDYVIDLPENRWRLGPRDVTFADGRVLHFPADNRRPDWCRPIDPDVRSQDLDTCWIAGILHEHGVVYVWETFRVRARRAQGEVVGHGFDFGRFQVEGVMDGAVVIRGYPVPLAEDAQMWLSCCRPHVETLEELVEQGGKGYAYFDTDQGEVTSVSCLCRI
jgi:hypothetical protein